MKIDIKKIIVIPLLVITGLTYTSMKSSVDENITTKKGINGENR